MYRFRKLFFLAMALMLVMIMPSSAFAAEYWVAQKDNSTYGNVSYGTHGWNHVPGDGPVTASGHVSSFYVWQPPAPGDPMWNMAETGWVSGVKKPTNQVWWFGAWLDNGIYNDNYVNRLTVSGPSRILDYSFTVRRYSSLEWRFYNWTLSQSTKHIMGAVWIGESQASSERWVGGDSNWSHFWGLQTRDSVGTWRSWSNQAFESDNDNKNQDANGNFLNKNGYYASKRSNTEFYVLIEP